MLREFGLRTHSGTEGARESRLSLRKWATDIASPVDLCGQQKRAGPSHS